MFSPPRPQGYTLLKCKLCGYEERSNFIPPVNSNGLAVEVNTSNNTCVITGIGTCTDTDVNIPEKISDYTVVGIADKAFADQTQITSITIPNTVKTLGQRAFYGCTGLTEFTVPASITSIGHQVFYKCDNLATVYYNSSFAPAQDKVFLNIPSIKTVVFGNIKRIPVYICYNSSIENVVIPDSVTSIGGYAFYGCSSLTNLYISDLESWLNVSLSNCSHPLSSVGGNLYIDGVLATDIVIPDSVTSIDSAFNGCRSLTSIEIPDSVTSVGNYTFHKCSSLTSIEIPDSVTSIGYNAFYNCSSLTSVYYGGDATKWAAISIDSLNSPITSATRYYYSATQPTASGNYWHYVDGKPTPW